MKVSIFDQHGQCIGIAWHENDEGVVEFEPATRELIAVFFSVNDGPKQSLAIPLRLPVDTFMRMRVSAPASRGAHKSDNTVDDTAPKMSWWERVWRWFVKSAAIHRHD